MKVKILIILTTVCSYNVFAIYPTVVVFDVINTLIPSWKKTHEEPFVRNKTSSNVIDNRGKILKLYPDVPYILHRLRRFRIRMSIASNTENMSTVQLLLRYFRINKYFMQKQIFPGPKVVHMNRIITRCRVLKEDILFFDNNQTYVNQVTKFGIFSYLAKNGMSLGILRDGLASYSKNQTII